MARGGMVAELRQRCRTLRDSIAARELATADEVASYWPKGAENPGTNLWAWIFCYGQMVRLNARRGEAGRPERSSAAADVDVLDALREEPIVVPLVSTNSADGAESPGVVRVYPKGLDALMHVHALDMTCGYLTAQRAAILANPTAEAMATLPRVLASLAYAQLLLCWIVTTPGAGMPYSSSEPTPKLPEYAAALSPWDVVRICRAHQQHLQRLGALSALIDETSQRDGGPRPSWSVFIGALSLDMGESPDALMKHHGLAKLLGMTRLNAAAKAIPDRPESGR